MVNLDLSYFYLKKNKITVIRYSKATTTIFAYPFICCSQNSKIVSNTIGFLVYLVSLEYNKNEFY